MSDWLEAMLEGKERDSEIKARKVFLFLNLQKLLGERGSEKITQIKPPTINSTKSSSLYCKSNYINIRKGQKVAPLPHSFFFILF